MPNKQIGQCYITSWHFGRDDNGEPYGVAMSYSSSPWGEQVPSYCYREFWL